MATSVVRTTAQTSPKFKITPLVGQITPTVTPPAKSDLAPAGEPTKVEYYLPYPGILPDHILYPLKMIRDRIWLFLTIDPAKKAELLLLFADKRLGAGQILIEGGKPELGISTVSKAEKYLERAIDQTKKAQEAGKETAVLSEKLIRATLKHEEVLGNVLLRISDQAKPAIEEALRYSRQGYQTVTRLLEEKR